MATSTGRVLREIYVAELPPCPSGLDTRKKNFETLTSYNWLDKDTPMILVPESPAKWTPQPPGTQLLQDSGPAVIDQNAYRSPRSSLEPLFRALFTEKPDFNLGDIDLVANRGGILKLFGSASGNCGRDYTINVQRFGNTTLFTRTEEDSALNIDRYPKGYGHNFETAYTEWPTGMENSVCHYRVARYEFGGIRCMIRFEVDASTQGDTENLHEVSDELSDLFSGISIDKTQKTIDPSTIKIIKHGVQVPHSSIMEIKTKGTRGKLDRKRVLTQAWFSATPSLVVASHDGGRFGDVRTMRMDAGDLDTWENSNAANLEKLVVLIKIILEEVEKAEGGRCIVYGSRHGNLTIRGSPGSRDVLPADLKERFL